MCRPPRHRRPSHVLARRSAWRQARIAAAAGLLVLCVGAALPALGATRPLAGASVIEAIRRLEAEDGLEVLFSSELVGRDLVVLAEPAALAPRLVLDELLAPHGLRSRQLASGRLVVVRAPLTGAPAARAPTPEAASATPTPEIVVTASRYLLLGQIEPSIASLDSADLQALPDLGDDPLRAVTRLPGAAGNGLSGKFNIRGGDSDETLVRFDGLRLYNPFHLKDFQSLFSTVDPALVRVMDVYTGGFPVTFGERMSGVVDIDPLSAPEEPLRLATASFYSAGLLLADSFNDGRSDWLVSARRGNIDLMLDAWDPKRGKPRYHDLHARLGHRLTERIALRVNALRFDDDLEVSDEDQEENATASYEDSYLWVTLDWLPTDRLASRTVLGAAEILARRDGSAEQPGISSGALHDERDSRSMLFQSDWRWQVGDRTRLAFGGEVRSFRGRFAYEEDATFDLLFDVSGAPTDPARTRSLRASPDGGHFAAYAGVQAALTPRLTADLGLRWDHDTLPPGGDDEIDPRLALLWRAGADTDFRLAAGRFSQAQSIEELQINDGIVDYFASQSADHLVGSLRHRFSPGLELRAELYEKRYRNLRPRFENLLNAFVILPELKPDRIRIDAREATARGLELSLTREDDGPLDWWLHYAWSSIRDETDAGEVRRSWDQSHALGAGIGWSSRQWDVTLAAAYHTGWPTTAIALVAADPQPLAGTGPRNGERLDHYRTLDLRVARRFQLEESLLTVFLELTNLTNRHNECCTEYEYNTEEETPFLETETSKNLPILPNLGVTWEF